MGYEFLVYERRGPVAMITLNRPEKLNALNPQLQDEQRAAVHEAETDDDIRAVVITGAGRAFSAGVDLSGRDAAPPADPPTPPQTERLDDLGWVGRQAISLYRMTKPTIAAVNGIAVGAGMSMALACDMRVGSELTRFKTIFVERSLSPDSGMSFFLPRVVGYPRAADLIFTNRVVEAEEAARLGLLDRLVPHDRLVEEAVQTALQIAAWPPMAVRSAKRVLQRNLRFDLEDALREETRGIVFARKAPHDVRESTMSFFEKRAPNFTGT